MTTPFIHPKRGFERLLISGVAAFGIPLSLLWCALPNLVAQAPPEFLSVQALTNREVALRISTAPSQAYRLETSPDLVAWRKLVTFKANSTYDYTDSAAPYSGVQFYRVSQLSDSNSFTGDHLETTAGEVIIQPITHATFALNWNGLYIYNDPDGAFATRPKADLVLVSHDHGDHFNPSALTSLVKAESILITTEKIHSSLSAALKAKSIPLKNGGHTNVLGMAIDAVPAYNANHPKGVGNGYVLTIGDKKLYMSGDTEDIPEMRALKDIDVAFLCMNVPYTMTVTRAASATREFRPGMVYPYHFRNADGSLANLNDFKRQVGWDLGIEVRIRKWY